MPAFGTRSSLFWWASGACIQDQIIPLQGLLGAASGSDHPSSGASGTCIRDKIFPLLVDFWSPHSGPDHPPSGASGACIQDQIIPLQGRLGPAFGTKSSLFWWASGACIRDQIIPLQGASGACIREFRLHPYEAVLERFLKSDEKMAFGTKGLIYLYSIHRVICRPSDHSVVRPRA